MNYLKLIIYLSRYLINNYEERLNLLEIFLVLEEVNLRES